ncbi:MAG: hypothetical protein EA424_26785 [Planctomycetaceae bacterium]|nr:MAG: hypothetical protein EA424_26785 [Planctomycetaceae bacterium]
MRNSYAVGGVGDGSDDEEVDDLLHHAVKWSVVSGDIKYAAAGCRGRNIVAKRIRKARAVLTVLGRLGFHAHSGDVVAELAKYGIEVNAGLVRKVKIELMKDASGVRRQKAKAAMNEPRPKVRAVRKTPARRSQGK